jgi:hypothetical protein
MSTARRAVIKNLAITEVPTASYWLTTTAFHLRHVLPEPFDIPQHMGNVMGGAAIGSIVGNVAAGIYCRFAPDESRTNRRTRTIAAACATIVSVAVSTAFETRTGIRLFDMQHIAGTPDILDFYYGVGTSAVTGAIAPTAVRESDLDHSVTENGGEVLSPEPDTNSGLIIEPPRVGVYLQEEPLETFQPDIYATRTMR